MNKAEFIAKLAEKASITKVDADKSLTGVLASIAEAMKSNDELRFVGFGTFKAKNTPETTAKTPSGAIAKVPAQRRITFSVGKEFKDTVNGK